MLFIYSSFLLQQSLVCFACHTWFVRWWIGGHTALFVGCCFQDLFYLHFIKSKRNVVQYLKKIFLMKFPVYGYLQKEGWYFNLQNKHFISFSFAGLQTFLFGEQEADQKNSILWNPLHFQEETRFSDSGWWKVYKIFNCKSYEFFSGKKINCSI